MPNGGFVSALDAFAVADCALYPVFAYMVHRGLVLVTKHPGSKYYYGRYGTIQPLLKVYLDH